MKRYEVSRDHVVNFHGHSVLLKKGQNVLESHQGTGGFYMDAHLGELVNKACDSIFEHDAKYYWLWVDKSNVRERM